MTKDMLITLLNQGNTGGEILQILETLVNDEDADIEGGYVDAEQDDVKPTLEPIAF